MHPEYLFGGRPDRHGTIYGLNAVLEGKSGEPEESHRIQTALQAILLAGCGESRLPPEAIARYCLYWKDSGKFKLIEHPDRRDFAKAREVIRACC